MLRLPYARFRIPGGHLTVVVDPTEDEAITMATFDSIGSLRERHRGTAAFVRGTLDEVADALDAYSDGALDAIDRLRVVQQGGPFMQRAWQAMRTVPAGSTITYADLAARAGSPDAWRAAGTACSSNMAALVVPCHRIVAAHGRLGGYGYGVDVKVALLEHEGALL